MESSGAFVAYIGALISLGLGIFGTFWPAAAANLVGIRFDETAPHSISEVRATYGGLFAGIGLYALISASPGAFIALGAGALGSGVVRLASIFADKTGNAKNWGGVIFEFLLAAILILPFTL